MRAQFIALDLVLLIVLSLGAFSRNENLLLLGYDGSYMRQQIEEAFTLYPMSFGIGSSVLQGIGDLRFPVNFRLSPATVVSMIGRTDPDIVVLYSAIALQLFVAMLVLGRSLGVGEGGSRLAAWLSVLFVQPFFNPPLFYPIAGLSPWVIESLAWQCLMISCLVNGFTQNRHMRLAWMVTALLIQGFLVALVAGSIILSVPVTLMTLGALVWLDFRSGTSRGFWRAALAFVLVGCLSMGPYIVGFLVYSVPLFFTSELAYGRPNMQYISILLYWPLGQPAMNTIIPAIALIGAVLAIRNGALVLRAFGWALIAGQLGLLALGLITSYAVRYRGPSTLYFEWFFWPLMFIFAAYLISELARRAVDLRFARRIFPGSASWIRTAASHLSIPATVLAVAPIILGHPYPRLIGYELPYPPALSVVPAKLKNAIGISPDGRWRGTAATFTSNRGVTESVDWGTLVSSDYYLMLQTGNDHRAWGLWAHHIPTLFQYNPNMSPFYYALMTRAFSTSSDPQIRSLVVMRVPRLELLRMLGVSHVILDSNVHASGLIELARQRLPYPDSRTGQPYEVALFSLADPNLNGFSPSSVHVAESAVEALNKLLSPEFDFRKTAVVHSSLHHPMQLPEIWTLRISGSGVHVEAFSRGPSMLVLPVQFSHCLTVRPGSALGSGAPTARLRRVNLVLTGLEFDGRIDLDLRYEMSPWIAETCRIRDYLDAKKLGLGKLAQEVTSKR